MRLERIGLGVDRSGDPRLRYVPDFAAPSIADVNFREVRHALGGGDLHVFADLDRTLRVTHGREVEPSIRDHIRAEIGSHVITTLCITTNSHDAQLERFGRQIHDEVAVYPPLRGLRKPMPGYFAYVAEQQGVQPDDTVLIVGDKYRRDVLGAYQAGDKFYSLCVEPLGERDLWFDTMGLRAYDSWLGRRAMTLCQQRVRAGQLRPMPEAS